MTSRNHGTGRTDEGSVPIGPGIEQAREQLGEAVRALADKVNVAVRATDVKDVKDTVRQAAHTAAARIGDAAEQAQTVVRRATDQARTNQPVDERAAATAARLGKRAGAMTDRALAALPPAAAEFRELALASVRRRPVQTAAAVAAIAGGMWLLRRTLRESR